MRHWIRRTLGTCLMLTLLLVGSGLFQPTTADTSAPPRGNTYFMTHLTQTQVDVLRAAYREHKALTATEARQLIESVANPSAFNLVKPASAGYASQSGACSYMQLWGYSNGYWHWHQEIDWMYPAELGEISISTDGFGATTDNRTFGFGYDEDFTGQLLFTGWNPTGTTMSGWMVMDDNSFCSGTLFAQW